MRRRDNPWYHAIGSALADPLEAEDPPLAGKTTWYYPQIPPEADKSAEDPGFIHMIMIRISAKVKER